MHDIDQNLQEFEFATNGEAAFEDEYEMEMEYEDEYEFEMEEEDEYEMEYEDEYEFEDETSFATPFSANEEMELASELLAVGSEEELDQFLGKLFKKVTRGARKVFRSPVFRGIGRAVKGIAKKALPIAGRTLGTYFGGPIGGKIGSKLGSFATRFFELELEGLSPEDQEFEIAKRIVRLAGTAAKKAARAPRSARPNAIVKAAMKSAARLHAPGLLKTKPGGHKRRSGKWMRKGNKIILFGA